MSPNSLPTHWRWTTLGEICNIIRGVTFPSEVQVNQLTDMHIACLRTTNVQEQVDWDDLIFIPRTYIPDRDKFIQKHDILISIANSRELVGKVSFVDEVKVEAVFGGFISVLRASEFVDAYYLYAFLRSNLTQERLRSVSNQTVNIANLTTKELAQLPVPLPPLFEQRRIAAILRKADEVYKVRLLSRTKSQKLLAALFVKKFGSGNPNIRHKQGWQVKNLGDLISDTQYGLSTNMSEDGDVGVLRMGNITTDGWLDFSNLKYLDKSQVDFLQYDLKPGDILFNRTNSKDLVGKTTLWEKQEKEFTFASYIIRVRVDENFVFPEYVWAYLNSPFGKYQIYRLAKQAVNMANINTKELASIKIILPPKELQKDFIDELTEVKNHLQLVERQHNIFQKLNLSLLARSFTGELTVNWRKNHQDELQRSAIERDKVLSLRVEKTQLMDFKEGRVTPDELEGLRKALGNFAVNLASYHIEMSDGFARSFEEITKPLTQSLVSMSQNLITPFLESFRQSLQNIQHALPVPPDEDEINRQIDILPLPQEKRAIHDVLDATSLRVLKLAHASPAYFTPEDLTFGGITSTHTSASLRVLDSLGFVRMVEIDGVLRYHVIDANTDTALKPN